MTDKEHDEHPHDLPIGPVNVASATRRPGSAGQGRPVTEAAPKVLILCGFAMICGFAGATLIYSLFNGLSIEVAANIAVAIGTCSLAYFTWESVRRTSDLIASEDRRHQQSLAPLLELRPYDEQPPEHEDEEVLYGYRVSNIGLGIAQNINARIEGSFPGDIQHVTVRRYKFEFSISALAPKSSAFVMDSDMMEALGYEGRIDFASGKIIYEDMFGNVYETQYRKNLSGYEWKQPRRLRVPTVSE